MYDITRPMYEGMEVYPGDPIYTREPYYTMEERGARVSILRFGSHTGTHMDAWAHFLPEGETLDRVPIETFVGAARLVRGGALKADPQPGERLLLDQETISPEEAELLVARKVALIGIAGLSVGDGDIHRKLLGGNVIPLEGLLLEGVPEGAYTLAALPMLIQGGDGGPVRAVLI